MQMRDDQGVPYACYYTDDTDWAAWWINQVRCSNGSRTYWSEWQPMYMGDPMGDRKLRLREAKTFVEREGK